MRRISAAGVALGAVGAVALLRRRALARRERVDLYYGDGSMVSLEDGSTDASLLLDLARDALRAATNIAR